MPLHAFCWGFTQEASNKQQNMRVILGLPGIFGDRSRPLSRSAILGDFNLGVVGSSSHRAHQSNQKAAVICSAVPA